MGLFTTAEEMPTEGAIRGLTGEAAEEADKAIADGLVRKAPFNQETEKVVGAIKRYLSQQGWGCKVRTVAGEIHWQVVEKKEISEEQKAKMLAGLEAARQAKAATKAATPPAEAPKAPEAPPAAPPAAPAAPAAKAQGSAKKTA